jgi:hypothetical protein
MSSERSDKPSPSDVSRITRLVDRVARRVRGQRATEYGVTGALVYLMILALALVLYKTGWVESSTFWTAALVAVVVPVGAALRGWFRHVDRVSLAQRIDRSHNLHDRLSTALSLAEGHKDDEFSSAQMRDALRYTDQVDTSRAAPFKKPTDLAAFAIFLAAVGVLAVIQPPSNKHPLPPPPEIKHDPVLDSATIAMERDRLEQLKNELEGVDDPEAKEMVAEIEELLNDVEEREISEKEFLERVDEIQEKYFDEEQDKATEELAEKLKKAAEELKEEAAEELEKEQELKEVVDALEEKDMEAASKALEKLAEKLENEEMSPEKAERMAKLLEKFAKNLDPDDKKLEELIEKHKKLAEELAKKFEGQNNMSEKDKQRLNRAQKELDKLKQKQEKQQNSQSSRQLKRLQRNTEEMAEKMKKQAQEQQGDKGEPQQKAREGESGEKSDYQQEASKQAKKASEQMKQGSKQRKSQQVKRDAKRQLDDMEEAMRRSGSKQGNSDGQQQSDGQRGERMKDFLRRARGEQDGKQDGQQGQKGQSNGEKSGRMPGEGQEGDPKKGEAKNAQKGNASKELSEKQTNKAGAGEGNRELGEETSIDSERKDSKVSGRKGGGPSKSEIIRSASEKGFATTDYKDVYVDYESVVEEVMEREEVPAGYRYYIKRYFELIKPRE